MEHNIILEMLKKQEQTLLQIKKELSTTQSPTPEIDMAQITHLSEQMQNSVLKIDEVVEAVRKPIISERRFTFNLESQSTVFIFIGMLIIIVGLSAWLYLATRPNYDRIDNDLKYRYIKMKGEATPDRISDLENIFEISRDNSKIRQLRKDVETYERAVIEKAKLDEQNRLRQLEAEKIKGE